MKKILVTVCLATMLVGCQTTNNPVEQVESISVAAENAEDDSRLPDLLNQFNKIAEEGNPSESKAFIEQYISTASELDADIMLTMYVDQQRSFLDGYSEIIYEWSYQNALLDAYDKSYNLDKLSGQYSKGVMTFLEDIKRDGFLLNYHEGIVTLYPDYNLLNNYQNYVSPSIQAYIEILSRESSEILSADGGLTITWDELAFRVLNAERYLVEYSDSIRYEEILSLYKWYLTTLLTGLPDTPIYYRNSSLIRNDVLQSYNKIIIHNTDTTTSEVLKGYLDIIRSKNNKVDGEALDYVRTTLEGITFRDY